MVFLIFLIFFIPETQAFSKAIKLTPNIDTWTLYAFGNGDIIAGIMLGLQSLVKSDVFVNLINLMLLIGFAWFILLHIGSGRLILSSTVHYVLFTAILLRILFGLTISIGLIDSVNPEYDLVVTEIPFLIGAPACFLSTIGHIVAAKLDEAYSQHASLPLSLTLTGGADRAASGAPFNIVAQMLMDGAQYSIQDPFLKNSLTYFIVDCVTPLINNGYLSSSQLLSSDNLWGLLDASHINPAIMTVYYHSDDSSFLGSVKTCRQAYELLNRDLQIAKPNFVTQWSKDITTGAAASLFQTVLTYTARQAQYAATPASYLQQAALLSILQGPSLSLMAMQTNSPLLMQRLSTEQAIRSAQTNWTTTAAVFQATFGYLYAALQVLVYAMAPIAMVLMVLPGLRILIMRRYLQLLAWFPVTLILLAVTNDILLYWSKQTLGQVWRSHGGLSVIGAPFISAKAANMTSVGAWLITLVPMIAWGLVAGFNLTMTALLNTTGIQALGSSAATQAVTGNIALDNQSYDNLNANKFSTTMKTDIGALPVTSYGSGSNIIEEDNLGGLSVLKNGISDMHAKQSTRQVTISHYALDTQGTADQKSLNNTVETSQSANAAVESVNKMTEKLHAGVKGGAIAGAVSGYIQKNLADENYRALDRATIKKVSEDIQTSALAQASASDAKVQGDAQQEQGFIEKSQVALDSALHTLSNKLGGGTQGILAASTLLGSAVALAKSTLKAEGEGALNLDTEAAHANKVDAVLSNRKSKQAAEQSLASSETRIGKQTTVTETFTDTQTSQHPGEDYYKAADIGLTKIHQKKQEIENKTGVLKQKADEAIENNILATQPKKMLDFKSSHAAKAAYQLDK